MTAGNVKFVGAAEAAAGAVPVGTDVATHTRASDGKQVQDVYIDPITTSTIYNITLTNANTEYSQALPANTREFRFRCRTIYDVRYAFATGKVATPTAPYLTLPAGSDYSSDGLNLAATTLYLASATAGVIIELECWT